MAFGGRELRLFLSIESYGVTNIRNLRRDIAGLGAATAAANRRNEQLVARQIRLQDSVNKLRNRATDFDQKRNELVNRRIGLESTLAAAQAKGMKAEQAFLKSSGERTAARLERATMTKMGLQQTQFFKKLGPNAKMYALQWASAFKSSQKATLQIGQSVAYEEKLNRDIMTTNTSLAKQEGLLRGVNSELAKQRLLLREAKKIDETMKAERIARQAAHIGRAAQFAGLLVTAGFGMAAGSFANFTNEASLAATQMRDTGASAAQAVQRTGLLTDAITELMMKFPATGEEMSRAAYDIFSSMNIVHDGIVDVAAGMRLLEVANKAAVAGGVDLEEATGAMIVTLNNFDPALRNVNNIMSQMFSIVRFGQMRLDEFAQGMSKIAPIAKTSGVSLAQAGSAFAAASITMKDTQMAATGVYRAIEMFSLPQVQKGMLAWGVKITDAHNRLLPLYDIVGLLIKRFPELATGQKSMVETLMQITKASEMTKVGIQGTAQARRVIAALATNYELYGNVLQNVIGNKKEFDEAFLARMQDPGVQWSILMNQMRALIYMIGKEAIPVFLAMGQRISDFIDWFRQLNPTVRKFIIQFGALTGLFLMIGGTLLNITASFAALKYSIALAGLEAGRAGRGFAALKYMMASFGTVALFVLIEQFTDLRTAIIYTAGAWVLWQTKAIQSIAAVVIANRLGASAVAIAWKRALIATGWGLLVVGATIAIDQIIQHWNNFLAFWEGLKAAIAHGWKNLMETLVGYTFIAVSKMQEPLYNLANRIVPYLGDAMRKVDELMGMSSEDLRKRGEEMIDSAGSAEAFRKAYNAAMKRFARDRKKDAKDLQKEWEQLTAKFLSSDWLKQQQAFADGIAGGDKAKQLAEARTDAIADAHKNMVSKIDAAVDNLMGIYNKFRQMNEQALGGLFQGPVMQGIFGNVFSEINNTLRQFGIQIPIPFEILRQDLDMSITYFKRWNTALSNLTKRGAPLEFVNAIRAMGPEAGLPIAEGLLAGGKQGFKDLIAQWKKGQKLLDKATKDQMDAQLEDWRKHGKDIAWAIINGIIDSPQQQALKDNFRVWVTDTFGSVLKDQMNQEVAEAMADAAAQIQASGVTSGGAGGGPPAVGGGGKPTIQQQIQSINKQQQSITQAIKVWQKKPVPGQMQKIAGLRGQWATLEGREQILRATRAANQAQAKLSANQRRQAEILRHQQAWAKSGKLPSPKQRAMLVQEALELGKLRADATKLQRQVNIRKQRQQALAVIQRQLTRGRAAGESRITVTYQGDSVTVNASGATPQSVLAALKRAEFARKNRNKNPRKP